MNPDQPIRHILVPHDFESGSDAALQYALALAKPFAARVTILHACEITPMAPQVLVLAADWIAWVGTEARERLAAVVERAKATEPAVVVESELREGAAWHEVEAFAKESGVDLVVLGSHGRRGLPRALLGSVAEKIVRTAPCPVLVVTDHAGGSGGRAGVDAAAPPSRFAAAMDPP